MGAFEDGSTFVAGVLAKIGNAEKRAQVEAILKDPDAKDAVTLIGDSVLARSDYSKHMDALKKQETDLKAQEADLKATADARLAELNEWYGVNKAALDDYKVLKANGGKKPDADDDGEKPPPDPRAIAEQVVNDAGREYILAANWLAAKAVEHLHRFGEPLDPSTFENPKIGKSIAGQPGRIFSLPDAYNEKYGERVAAKQKEADEKKFNDEVERRLKEERAKFTSQPFPLRGEVGPSVLDTLDTKDGSAAHTLDTAVSEYERLQQARGV